MKGYFLKNGPFLNAKCIMYSISIFYFTFYSLGRGAYAPNAPAPAYGPEPAGAVSHKPGGRLPLLSARPAITPTTLKRAATSFAAWRTEARWV